MISIKLLWNFIEIALRDGCSLINFYSKRAHGYSSVWSCCEKPNMQILGTIFKWNLDLLVIFSFTTVKKTGWSKEVINGELKSIFLPSFENYNCWASCAENFGSRLEWPFINIWFDKLTDKFEVLNLNIIYYKLDADEITDCSYLILFIIKRLS